MISKTTMKELSVQITHYLSNFALIFIFLALIAFATNSVPPTMTQTFTTALSQMLKHPKAEFGAIWSKSTDSGVVTKLWNLIHYSGPAHFKWPEKTANSEYSTCLLTTTSATRSVVTTMAQEEYFTGSTTTSNVDDAEDMPLLGREIRKRRSRKSKNSTKYTSILDAFLKKPGGGENNRRFEEQDDGIEDSDDGYVHASKSLEEDTRVESGGQKLTRILALNG